MTAVSAAEAILLAAGAGTRLGAGGPKAFVELAGQPLVMHALRALLAAETIEYVIVVVGVDDMDRMMQLLEDAAIDAGVAAGGATRFESVDNGMQSLVNRNHVVAVHDAARPLVSPTLVDRAVRALEAPWQAVAPALPVVDTLKLVDGEQVVRTVDRGGLYAVQTPQVFGRLTLERAHERWDGSEASDDLVLVEERGEPVRLIPGERTNFKITHPPDLVIAEALLATRARR